MSAQTLRCLILTIVLLTASVSTAETLSPEAVNNAELDAARSQSGKPDATIVKAQILLDRARYSPGEIDGKQGENFRKALRAFAHANGLETGEELTPGLWAQLKASASEPIIRTYRVIKSDVEGPFLGKQCPRLRSLLAPN